MKTPCNHPGCPSLVNRGGYCPTHAKDKTQSREEYEARRRKDPALAAAMAFRSSRRWQKTQRTKISLNPLCEDPFGDHDRRGTTETAKQVHHIVGLAECAGDERAYTLDNLMSVCWKCHARIEREVRKQKP